MVLLRFERGDRLRTAGSAGVAFESSGDASARQLADMPNARIALEEDRVVVDPRPTWRPGELGVPDDAETITYTPVSAGSHWFGVFLSDAGRDDGRPGEVEGEATWMLGKMAALALSARHAAIEDEHAREVGRHHRLGRELEKKVTQRMLAVAVTLADENDRGPGARVRCSEELDAAHATLRRIFTRELRARGQPRARARALS